MKQNTSEINQQPFAGVEVVSRYTREQALADGVLVTVPQALAREAGFRWPVAITENVFHRVVEVPDHPKAAGQTWEGRLRDVLQQCAGMLRRYAGKAGDRGTFNVIATGPKGRADSFDLVVVASSEGPRGAPVLTIMFPEDE